MAIDLPPQLILPEHYRLGRPAIIRAESEFDRLAKPVKAGVLPGLGLSIIGGEPPPVNISLIDYGGTVAAASATRTFSVTGAARTGGWIVCVVQRSTVNNRIPTGVTLGGTALTMIASAIVTSGGVSFWHGNVTFSGSANIVATYAGNANEGVGYLIAVDNLLSTTPYATASDTSDPLSVPVAVQAGGAILGGSFSAALSSTATWTGITELADVTAYNYCSSSLAGSEFASASGSVAITATHSAGTAFLFFTISIR